MPTDKNADHGVTVDPGGLKVIRVTLRSEHNPEVIDIECAGYQTGYGELSLLWPAARGTRRIGRCFASGTWRDVEDVTATQGITPSK